MGRYFVGLLNDLGYRASLRLYREHHAYYTAVGTPASHVQIGNMAWFADYQAASSFFQPLLTCDRPAAAERECVGLLRARDRRPDRARDQPPGRQSCSRPLRLGADRPRDHAPGPLLPLVNPIGVDFVARRVGNYQRSQALEIARAAVGPGEARRQLRSSKKPQEPMV